jgi:cyclic pyranopterin phosphate synthase
MVDVGHKPVTAREAVARGHITLSADAIKQVRAGTLKKGDPLETARLAGIMAAKQTATLIPLCHPLPISHADVQLTPVRDGYDIEATVRTTAQTGVEMEALTAVSVAALTIYDMVKAVDKAMVISDICLLKKTKAAVIPSSSDSAARASAASEPRERSEPAALRRAQGRPERRRRTKRRARERLGGIGGQRPPTKK